MPKTTKKARKSRLAALDMEIIYALKELEDLNEQIEAARERLGFIEAEVRRDAMAIAKHRIDDAEVAAKKLREFGLATVAEAERQARAVMVAMRDDRDNAAAPWNCH